MSPIWARFIRDVTDLCSREIGVTLVGVRVLERHKSGFLHYHAIVNIRIPIDRVLAIGKRYGIGRTSVTKINTPKGAVLYMAKYLTKETAVKGRGCRLKSWGTVGDAFFSVKRSEVKTDNRGTRFWKRLREELPWAGEKRSMSTAIKAMRWQWAGFRAYEDFVIFYAKENWDRPWERFWPLNASYEWLVANMDGIGGAHEMDGNCPF